MLKSFFPKLRTFFLSAFVWALIAVIFWQVAGGDWVARITGASGQIPISAAPFWSLDFLIFYAYYIVCVGLFALFWFINSPHRWQYWSILGTALIIFVTGFLVEVGVAVNAWYAPFYDLIQTALSSPLKVTIEQFYREVGVFLGITLIAVVNQCDEQLLCQPLRVPLAYSDERILHGELATTASYRRCRTACTGRHHAFCFNAGEYGGQLYFHYMYFNIGRIIYLQVDNVFGLFLLFPSIVAGTITLGLMT